MKVMAVIVAAGISTNLGDFKKLSQSGEISMAERVILNFKGAGINDIVMVTGHKRKELEKALNSYGITFLQNENFKSTDMLTSVKIGFSYAMDKAERILFTPVDIPFFKQDTVTKLLSIKAPLVCPMYNDIIGHPLNIDVSLIPQILEYNGTGGLRQAFNANNIIPTTIPVADIGSTVDADKADNVQEMSLKHSQDLDRPVIEIGLAKNTLYFNTDIMTLLKHIDGFGSVANACERSGISYSQAWKYIKAVESQTGYEIVKRSRGGEHGGEATITEQGRELMKKYALYASKLNKIANELYKEIF